MIKDMSRILKTVVVRNESKYSKELNSVIFKEYIEVSEPENMQMK